MDRVDSLKDLGHFYANWEASKQGQLHCMQKEKQQVIKEFCQKAQQEFFGQQGMYVIASEFHVHWQCRDVQQACYKHHRLQPVPGVLYWHWDAEELGEGGGWPGPSAWELPPPECPLLFS